MFIENLGIFAVLSRISRAAVVSLAFVGAGGAQAQSDQTFEEFQAQVKEGAARIAQYQQVLQNPDARVQYEAVKLMLKSKDPALVRIAKEHALFSTNPVLRNAAIQAIFDSGGTYRVEVTSLGESSAKVLKWLADKGGTHDGRVGSAVFTYGRNTGTCWMANWRYNDFCQLTMAGTTVQFRSDAGDDAQATLTLGPDGVLRGVIFSAGGKANAAIDLKE